LILSIAEKCIFVLNKRGFYVILLLEQGVL
jgi:hypothetical protein